MIGIAIINYKTYEKTIKCINSIRDSITIPYKIYLLDNGSNNDSAKELLFEYNNAKDVKVIISEQNLGYAKGNNLCIQYMLRENIEYGVISNNDILCQKQTIEKLVEDLRQYENLLLVGPKIYSPDMKFQCSVKNENIKGYYYLLNSMYISSLWKKKKHEEEKKWDNIESIVEAKWISGAFFAFSMKNMKKIGFFDPTTFLFFEEAILSNKAERCRLKLAFEPKSVVIHDHAFSTGGGLNIVSRIAADKSERYYFQNYIKANRFFIFLLKIVRSVEVVYSFGKRKQFNYLRQYFKEMKMEVKKENG